MIFKTLPVIKFYFLHVYVFIYLNSDQKFFANKVFSQYSGAHYMSNYL